MFDRELEAQRGKKIVEFDLQGRTAHLAVEARGFPTTIWEYVVGNANDYSRHFMFMTSNLDELIDIRDGLLRDAKFQDDFIRAFAVAHELKQKYSKQAVIVGLDRVTKMPRVSLAFLKE